MTKTKISTKSRRLLRRLSVIHADDLRLKIVTELFLREMSPTQFFEEFGGGSASRVNRHFERLAEYGWLRLVRVASGGSRRGGKEHFYRATELALFDEEVWSLLPHPVRASYGWRTFRQLAERVREALEAGTFDALPGRHLSSTSLLLDRLGWERVLVALEALFESLLEEQADAKLRMFTSGEEPFLVTIALAGFESPAIHRSSGKERADSSLVEGVDCSVPTTVRLSKILADELCLSILTELNLRAMSATLFYREIGGASLSVIRRRFKKLRDNGWLRKVDEKTGGKRRGAKEHFYRATVPMLVDGGVWSEAPEHIKATDDWKTFVQLTDLVKEAIRAGTFDDRTDRHLTWWLFRLDRLGWEKIIASIEATSAFVFEEQDEAKRRMADSGETPINMTVALAAFESPKDRGRAP